MATPIRGEVWTVDLNPVRGLKQVDLKPALVVSVNLFNRGPAGLAVVLPLSTQSANVPFHLPVEPPEAGLKEQSFIQCEDVRSVSKQRLIRRWGSVSAATMELVEDRLRILFDL